MKMDKKEETIEFINIWYGIDMTFITNFKITYFDRDDNILHETTKFKRQKHKQKLEGLFPEYRVQINKSYLLEHLDIINNYEIEFMLLKRIKVIVKIYKTSKYFMNESPIFYSYFINDLLQQSNNTEGFPSSHLKYLYNNSFTESLKQCNTYSVLRIFEDKIETLLSNDLDIAHFFNALIGEVELLEQYTLF